MLTIEIIKTEIEHIAKEYNMKKVYVFGSYAKGLEKEDSDVDLLVEKPPNMSLISMSSFLSKAREALGISVDVISTKYPNKDFLKGIWDDKVLIYEE